MPRRRRTTQVSKPPIAPGMDERKVDRGLLLPHERDESSQASTPDEPDPVMVQAKRDLDRGLVDTDLRTTPGLDAAQRERLLETSFEPSEQPRPPKPRSRRGKRKS